MFGWFWINFCRHGMQYGAESLSLPTVKGWDWRFKDGGGYLALLLVTDPNERKAREERFRVAIKPFIENFDGIWKGFVDEMVGRYDKLKSLNLDTASNIQLLANFEETIDTTRRMWEIHMYMMYGVYTAFVLFEQLTKQLLGIDDTSPEFHKLTSGFDNKSFQVDKGLFDLAKVAQGSLKPHEPQYYARLDVSDIVFRTQALVGCGYDRKNNLLYAMELDAVGEAGNSSSRLPIVHVWRINRPTGIGS